MTDCIESFSKNLTLMWVGFLGVHFEVWEGLKLSPV